MGRDSTLLFIALAVAITAAVWDIKQRRIPNWLTYPGIGLGVALRGLLFGWKGLGSAVDGLFARRRNHVSVLRSTGHGSGRREADGGDRIAGGTQA